MMQRSALRRLMTRGCSVSPMFASPRVAATRQLERCSSRRVFQQCTRTASMTRPQLSTTPFRHFATVSNANEDLMSPVISGPDHEVPPVHIMQRVSEHGSRPFMRDGDRIYTYADLQHFASMFSSTIQPLVDADKSHPPPPAHAESTSPLPPRVALLVPSSFEYAVATLAVWQVGAVCVPLHPAHPVSELQYILQDSAPCALVYHPSCADKAAELSTLLGVPILPQVVAATRDTVAESVSVEIGSQRVDAQFLGDFPPVDAPLFGPHSATQPAPEGTQPTEPDTAVPAFIPDVPLRSPALSQPALFIYTSGTTGRPKAVVITHSALHAQITAQVQMWGWTAADHILNVLPLHHIHGVVNVFMTAMWVGARVTTAKFDAERVWELICSGVDPTHTSTDRCAPQPWALTLFMAVPTIYSKLIDQFDAQPHLQLLRSAACAQFRLMVSGSMALPTTTMHKWREVSGHTLLERYGMTEVGMALTNPYHGRRVEGSVGQPMAGVQVRLLTQADNSESAAGAAGAASEFVQGPGELLVRGPNVFHEYYNKRSATAASFLPGDLAEYRAALPHSSAWFDCRGDWFLTGDVAAVDTDGNVHLLGRASVDILKISGYKVSALDVERVLLDHPAIAEVAVVGVPSKRYGQTICAVVVPRAGEPELTLSVLREWCRPRMAEYKMPRALWLCDSIPRNAMGKVNKKHLLTCIPADVLPAE